MEFLTAVHTRETSTRLITETAGVHTSDEITTQADEMIEAIRFPRIITEANTFNNECTFYVEAEYIHDLETYLETFPTSLSQTHTNAAGR